LEEKQRIKVVLIKFCISELSGKSDFKITKFCDLQQFSPQTERDQFKNNLGYFEGVKHNF